MGLCRTQPLTPIGQGGEAAAGRGGAGKQQQQQQQQQSAQKDVAEKAAQKKGASPPRKRDVVRGSGTAAPLPHAEIAIESKKARAARQRAELQAGRREELLRRHLERSEPEKMFANRHWSHAERARTIGTKPLPALLSGGSGLQQPGSMVPVADGRGGDAAQLELSAREEQLLLRLHRLRRYGAAADHGSGHGEDGEDAAAAAGRAVRGVGGVRLTDIVAPLLYVQERVARQRRVDRSDPGGSKAQRAAATVVAAAAVAGKQGAEEAAQAAAEQEEARELQKLAAVIEHTTSVQLSTAEAALLRGLLARCGGHIAALDAEMRRVGARERRKQRRAKRVKRIVMAQPRPQQVLSGGADLRGAAAQGRKSTEYCCTCAARWVVEFRAREFRQLCAQHDTCGFGCISAHAFESVLRKLNESAGAHKTGMRLDDAQLLQLVRASGTASTGAVAYGRWLSDTAALVKQNLVRRREENRAARQEAAVLHAAAREEIEEELDEQTGQVVIVDADTLGNVVSGASNATRDVASPPTLWVGWDTWIARLPKALRRPLEEEEE